MVILIFRRAFNQYQQLQVSSNVFDNLDDGEFLGWGKNTEQVENNRSSPMSLDTSLMIMTYSFPVNSSDQDLTLTARRELVDTLNIVIVLAGLTGEFSSSVIVQYLDTEMFVIRLNIPVGVGSLTTRGWSGVFRS